MKKLIVRSVVIAIALFLGLKMLPIDAAVPPRIEPPEPKAVGIETEPLDRAVDALTGSVTTPQRIPIIMPTRGQINHVADGLRDGVYFKRGQWLLGVNTNKLVADVATAESELAEARLNLEKTVAEAAMATRAADVGGRGELSDLAKFVPQLNLAKTAVAAKKAALDYAKQRLKESKVYAPFDGRVVDLNVYPGQIVLDDQPVGYIAQTEYLTVRFSLGAMELANIRATPSYLDRDSNMKGRSIKVTAKYLEREYSWNATVERCDPSLAGTEAQCDLIARISHPYKFDPAQPDRPFLTNDTIVKADLAQFMGR